MIKTNEKEITELIRKIDKKVIPRDCRSIDAIFSEVYKEYSLCPKTNGFSNHDFIEATSAEKRKSQALFIPNKMLFIKYEYFHMSYCGGVTECKLEIKPVTKNSLSKHQLFLNKRYSTAKNLIKIIKEKGITDSELWLGEDYLREEFKIGYEHLTKEGFKEFQKDVSEVLSLDKSKYLLIRAYPNIIAYSNRFPFDDKYDHYPKAGPHVCGRISNKKTLGSFRIILDDILKRL